MWVDFHNSCKTSLRIQYVSFRMYTIYWLLWSMFAVCEWWHASSNICYTKNKNIVYVIFLSLHYLKYVRLFCRKTFELQNTKRYQKTYCSKHNIHTWHVEIDEAENIQNNRVREGMLNFFQVHENAGFKVILRHYLT